PARHRAEPAAPSAMPPRPIRAEMSAPRPASATPSATVAAAPPIGASHDSEAAFDEQFSSDLEEAFREEIPAGRTGSRPAAASLERSATRSDRLEVAPPEPPSMPAQQRGESMEEEMQRLLDELSGSKPN
ncbi:MAG: hypothetical protein VYD64_08795, partial [Pseudomonadota bacterium]|nr:hypothetical protein [Pseudomonadota bacterium]